MAIHMYKVCSVNTGKSLSREGGAVQHYRYLTLCLALVVNGTNFVS